MDDEIEKETCDSIFNKISISDIYRIPISQQKNHELNPIISKHVTKDLFPNTPAGRKRYRYWKKHPVKAISYLDQICRFQSMHFMNKSKDSSSPIIKILLRLKGENKMEQLEEVKEGEVAIPVDFVGEIKRRSQALADQDQYKKALIQEAKKKGWLGVTVEEIDLDMTENYRKLSAQLDKVTEFEKPDLELLKTLQSIGKDKRDIQKFQMLMSIKLAELEEKRKMRKDISGLKLDKFDIKA